MTAKEAIMILESIQPSCGEKYSFSESEIYEAIDMAIEALNHSEIPNSSDCIDRAEAQTAIQFAARRYTVAHEAHGEGRVVWSDNLISVIDAMNALREVPSTHPDVPDTNVGDMISRQDAIDSICKEGTRLERNGTVAMCEIKQWCVDLLERLPSVKPERDIPIKPNETTDKAWGIPKRQAVCPKCDYYLGHVAFLGDYKGKRITYCETCGQAIDWEGWKFDE